MADDGTVDLSGVSAGDFARLVAASTPEQLEASLADPVARTQLLDEVFRRMESHVRSERVRDMHSVVQWRFPGGSGPDGYDRYVCTLSDGRCIVSRETTESPRVTITVGVPEFVRLITGQANPPMLFVTGKLQVKGDLAFAAGLIGYFDLPQA